MKHFLDMACVGAILLVSLVYAATALGPRSLRLWVIDRLLGLARRIGWGEAWSQRLLASRERACGACGSCSSQTRGDSTSSAREVRVAARSIGTRRKSAA